MKSVVVVSGNNDLTYSISKIAEGLTDYLLAHGYEAFGGYARNSLPRANSFLFGGKVASWWHHLLFRFTGLDGSYSRMATKRLLREMERRKVDTVYLMMAHSWFINETMFFDYIKRKHLGLVYVMLDEYCYLGKCHFSQGCTAYLQECRSCPQVKKYPQSFSKQSGHKIYLRKKANYAGLERSVFVGPQMTLDRACKSPLLEGKKMRLADESIDVSVYRPRDTKRLREELGISAEKIVCMCVAVYDGAHHERKGVPYYIELARRFENDERYVFVQVAYVADYPGGLPKNYIPIGFVRDKEKVAEYLSLGDLFIFPSLADTMPNTCIEALACGTPLLCWRIYGNETMAPEELGTFVTPKSLDEMESVVRNLQPKTQEMIDKCRAYAVERYDNQRYFEKLVAYGEELGIES